MQARTPITRLTTPLGVVALALASACAGGGGASPSDDGVALLDDEPLVGEDGKSDTVTKSVTIGGDAEPGTAFEAEIAATTYLAWRIEASSGETLSFDVRSTTASREPVALIYGPRAGTSWGKRLARVVGLEGEAFATATLEEDGTYLVVTTENRRRRFAAEVTASLGEETECASEGGTCRALSRSGCGTDGEVADARTHSCGPPGIVGVMCCLPKSENACEDAGGTCTGLRPGACGADGRRADLSLYPCGPAGAVGVTCCLPLCKPRCGAVGSRSEGWYDGCSGALLGWQRCSGKDVECREDGTDREGWYVVGGSSTPVLRADCE